MEPKIPHDLRWWSALETRIAMLQKKAEQQNIKLPKDVTRYIAQNLWSHAKGLGAALTRLIAHSRLSRTEVTRDYTIKILKTFIDSQRVKGTVDSFPGTFVGQRGTHEAVTQRDDGAAANLSVVFKLGETVAAQKLSRVRRQFEVNMRELERGRLARLDAYERWVELQDAKRKRG